MPTELAVAGFRGAREDLLARDAGPVGSLRFNLFLELKYCVERVVVHAVVLSPHHVLHDGPDCVALLETVLSAPPLVLALRLLALFRIRTKRRSKSCVDAFKWARKVYNRACIVLQASFSVMRFNDGLLMCY